MPLLLKKSLYGKNDDIQQAINNCESNNNILYFNDPDELYENYYKDINPKEISLEKLSCYNEIYNTVDPMFTFFMDIDVKKDEYDNQEIMDDSDNIENDNKKNIHNMLGDIITKFIKYLLSHDNKILCIQKHNEKEIYDIDNDSKNEILNSIYITKNKNFNKYSFHIYFSKLIINEDCIYHIKNIIKQFKSIHKNILTESIDEQVYKKNLSLRILYCKKNKEDIFYHYPIQCTYKKNKLNIIDEEIDLTKKDYRNYLFTYDKTRKNYFMVQEYISAEEKNLNIIINMEKLNLYETYKENPYHYFLTLKKIFGMIFTLNNQLEFDFKNNLKNIKMFENEESLEKLDKKIVLEFIYENYKCMFCNAKKHKNVHVVHIGKVGINIIKEGRSSSCKIKSIPFKKLDELEICEFIYSKNLIKKISNDLIVFIENDGWVLTKNDFSILKKLLLNNKHYFFEREILTIHKMSETKIKEHFNSLITKKDIVSNFYPYLFKFSNGIYNIKEDKLIKIEDSKDIYIINGVNYDYVDEKDYTEEQKKDKIFLENVIDQIMPKVIDNKTNKNRIIFETNLSSCILMARKNVITVFQGETSAGKTTIKNLIVSTLGSDNYVDLPVSTYTNTIDPNKPNPWLGSIENKRVSFASESYFVDKLNSQTIKLLTEVKILCRNMYSSETGQINMLSQFIDTNHALVLDNPEAAAYKRLAIVNFNSHFKSKNNGAFFLTGENSQIKNNFEEKNNLSDDILNNKYSLIFFNILKKWAKFYHNEKIILKNTSELSDFCILNTAIMNTTFPGYNFDINNIKKESKNEYKIVKLQNNISKELKTVVCNSSYFKKYYNNFINNNKLDINLNSLIAKSKFERKNKSYIPFVLVKDIKEDILENVIEEYNKNINCIKKGETFSLLYYQNNKSQFESFKDNIVSEDSSEEDI